MNSSDSSKPPSADPPHNDIAAWFIKAHRDIRVGFLALQDAPPVPDLAAYHAHCAAEKALKGFLASHGLSFHKTRNVVAMGQACASIDATLGEICGRVKELAGYAEAHLPADKPDPSPAEAQNALILACKIFDEVLSRMPAEVQARVLH